MAASGAATGTRGAYAGPAAVLGLWVAGVVLAVPTTTGRFALVSAGGSVVLVATQLTGIVAGVVGYRAAQPELRTRLRWLALTGCLSIGLGLVGWVLPELVTGRQLLPGGAIGLAGLPFVAGLAIALRRHHLFDIERLVNRSLVYGIVLGRAGGRLRRAGCSAGRGARPLRRRRGRAGRRGGRPGSRAVARTPPGERSNRLMYGHRDEPARVLNDLGTRLQSVLLPSDVLPAAVVAVADSLRVPYVAVDLADGTGEFRPAAEHGRPLGPLYEDAAGAPR